jgi:hypothetical protein
MLVSNPTGVAVQLVKWYQYMALYWELNDSHHIQIFKAVNLDSYVIFGLWSTSSSAPAHILQRSAIFFHIISTCATFRNFFFLQNVCFDFLYKLSLKHFLLWEIRVRINQKHPSVFMSKSRFSFQIYSELDFRWQMFENYPNINYN